jgi:hypothetical protein
MKCSLARWVQRTRWFQYATSIALVAAALPNSGKADPIAAHHLEGTLHGYLSMRNEAGEVLAAGDLIQVVHGDRVTAHLTFHFKDGSLDDETTVFSQRGTFQLVNDHHVQKGPFFAHPMDMFIDARKGEVIVRSLAKDGKSEDAKTEQMKFPPDLCSGLMVIPLAKNLSPSASGTEVSMVVGAPKPRLVKIAFSGQGEDDFSLAGFERKARHFEIKFDLQGAAGVIAPLVGKQPPNIEVWIQDGEVPAFVKEEGPLSEGSQIVSIQQTGLTGPNKAGTASGK